MNLFSKEHIVLLKMGLTGLTVMILEMDLSVSLGPGNNFSKQNFPLPPFSIQDGRHTIFDLTGALNHNYFFPFNLNFPQSFILLLVSTQLIFNWITKATWPPRAAL